tara:strand:- start:491 stop:691 length:201 start_codon:yes stop_codon:yes gene_type:complete
LILIKEVKNLLFNGLADWVIDRQPNYLFIEECKSSIKKKNSKYIISKNEEKKIFKLLKNSYESTYK